MNKQLWFATGSQHLYGEETLKQVAANSKQLVDGLNAGGEVSLPITFKKVLTTANEITQFCKEASNTPGVVGVVLWMHTFSPAKMWIQGLKELTVPFVHLHTQFGRDIPWSEIDMDFMNLNQSAHGGREFGFICSRLRIERTVISGHWQEKHIQKRLGSWANAALGWHDSMNGKIARFGDNMREVAVTEGDKVEAQIKFGYAVHGYGIGDLVQYVDAVKETEIDALIEEYDSLYEFAADCKKGTDLHDSVRYAAKIEAGMEAFLSENGFTAFTTTFENLYGLKQLPGLAVQRLMAKGYGFGGEGDWKTAAFVRTLKVIGGLEGATSFMEDYTYHLDPANKMVLGAHMLEVCPTIADGKPRIEVHPLSIGGKEAPARLVFTSKAGPALNASLIDLGNRFRLVVNTLEAVKAEHALPKLPVANVLWKPDPDLETAANAWIHAGGAHHSAYSQAVSVDQLEDFASMANIELVIIDKNTNLRALRQELRWNDSTY